MSASMIRIVICVIVGILLCSQGLAMMNEPVFTSQLLGTVAIGCGLLIIIFGFSPSAASAVISAIVKIISLPFKLFG
jgi:hypothetical protein